MRIEIQHGRAVDASSVMADNFYAHASHQQRKIMLLGVMRHQWPFGGSARHGPIRVLKDKTRLLEELCSPIKLPRAECQVREAEDHVAKVRCKMCF